MTLVRNKIFVLSYIFATLIFILSSLPGSVLEDGAVKSLSTTDIFQIISQIK